MNLTMLVLFGFWTGASPVAAPAPPSPVGPLTVAAGTIYAPGAIAGTIYTPGAAAGYLKG